MKKAVLLASGRKITLPEPICEELEITEGDQVVLEVQSNSVLLTPLSKYEVKE